MKLSQRYLSTLLLPLLAGCATHPGSAPQSAAVSPLLAGPQFSEHREGDDLLSAGLGLEGLRSPTLPALALANAPSAAELRRRAIWSNWRGITDFSPSGFGSAYGAMPAVPGREIQALLRLPDSRQPHRVLLQLPDAFDPLQPCVLVTASSGSRGIYGAIALAGGWGLPRGCAVIYTDKGAGTDWLSAPLQRAHQLDGLLSTDAETPAAFALEQVPNSVAVKHLHSQDNPEARWGEYVIQAARWGLQMLDTTFPQAAPFDSEATKLIAVGISNGGGAVLQAAGLDGPQWDGVVAISPNILAGEGGRALYDVASEAAIWMPCALQDLRFDNTPFTRINDAGAKRCAALRAAGLLEGQDLAAQASAALQRLRDGGWTDAALDAAALSSSFDVWRAVAAGYASAYTRRSADDMPCGYRYAVLDSEGRPRPASLLEQQLWWSDSNGIPPSAGVMLIDAGAGGDDPALPALRCLRDLWSADSDEALALRQAVDATRARRPPVDLPIYLLHGEADGLVPMRFSSQAYADWVKSAPNALKVTWLPAAQHFDAFLGLPQWQGRYQALLPHAYSALDGLWAELDAAPMPAQ